MTEEQTFIDAIVAEPDDATHRLVFADWLEENDDETGDRRAAVLRWWTGISRDVRHALDRRWETPYDSLPWRDELPWKACFRGAEAKRQCGRLARSLAIVHIFRWQPGCFGAPYPTEARDRFDQLLTRLDLSLLEGVVNPRYPRRYYKGFRSTVEGLFGPIQTGSSHTMLSADAAWPEFFIDYPDGYCSALSLWFDQFSRAIRRSGHQDCSKALIIAKEIFQGVRFCCEQRGFSPWE